MYFGYICIKFIPNLYLFFDNVIIPLGYIRGNKNNISYIILNCVLKLILGNRTARDRDVSRKRDKVFLTFLFTSPLKMLDI